MEINDLIHKLSQNVKPVRRLPPVSILLLVWLAGALLCLFWGVRMVGCRLDLGMRCCEPTFILESVLLLSAAIFAAASALAMSVPGTTGTYLLRRLTFVFLGLWILVLFYRAGQWITEQGYSALPAGLEGYCPLDLFLLGLLPALLLLVLLRRAAPLDLGWSGILALLAVGSLAAFGVQFTCVFGSPIHVLIYHALPVIGLGLTGYFLGRWLLRRNY